MRWLAAALLMSATAAQGQSACTPGDGAWIDRACYEAPRLQGRYGHDILGDTPEWTRLDIHLGPEGQAADWAEGRSVLSLRQSDTHIFEDIAPRVVQLDASGPPEIVVVDTAYDVGARLGVVNLETGRFAATPYIGRRNRWLAPAGAADLDGDGRMEIAYVDRPHLAKTLLVWRYTDGGLRFVTELAGVTNHRIGEPDIGGGIRVCPGERPVVITASADWSRVIGVTLDGRILVPRDLGPHRGRADLSAALAC